MDNQVDTKDRDAYQTILVDGKVYKPGARSEKRLGMIRWDDVVGRTVLDIGCNNGMFCVEAKRRGAARVIGIERSNAAKTARNVAAAQGLDVEIWQADVESPEVRRFTPQADIVFFFAMLNHMKDKAGVLDWIDSITERFLYYETNFENKPEPHLDWVHKRTSFHATKKMGESGDKPGQYHMFMLSRDDRDVLKPEWGECPIVMLDPNDIKIGGIRGYPGGEAPNIRAHIDRVKAAIGPLGIRRPLFIKRRGSHFAIAEGGHRLYAARELAYTAVPCRIIP